MSDPTQGEFIRITNREIYDALRHLEKTVDSMDERMNAVLNENVTLGKRIRALELKTYAIMSGGVSLIGLGGLALAKGVFGG